MKSSIFLLCLPLSLAGCATQTYEAKPLDPAATYEAYQARDFQQSALQAYMIGQGYPSDGFPIKQWAFPELTMAALFYHPALETARAEWRAARAGEATAAQKPNPGISTQLEHHSRQDAGDPPWTYGFSIDIPVETGDKREARIERAAAWSETRRIDIAQTAWQVRSNLQLRLLDLHANSLRIRQQQQEIKLHQDIVQMLQNRVEAGMLANLDLNQARLALQKSQQSLVQLENNQQEARVALAAAIGVPLSALDSIRLDLTPPKAEALPGEPELQRAALLNRLDIRAGLARYAAAEADLKLEVAKQYPDITLSPGYLFDQGDHLWTLGLNLLLNLGDTQKGPIAEARARRELAATQFMQLQAGVVQQLEEKQAAYQSALREVDKMRGLLESQLSRSSQSQRQFDAGYSDRLELTATLLEQAAAERALLEAEMHLQLAHHALEDLLQQPLDAIDLTDLPEPESPQHAS